MNRLSGAAGGLLVVASLFTAGAIEAQNRQSAKVDARFDVTSIRPVDADNKKDAMAPRLWGDDETGRVSLHHITLENIFTRAFNLRDDQIVGPGWLETDFFDILATAPKNSQSEEVAGMLRNMLVDRFKLAWHMDSKTSPVYALTVSPKGSRMKEVPEALPPSEPEKPMAFKRTGSAYDVTISSGPPTPTPFGPSSFSASREGQDMVVTIVYSSMTMAGLSKFLTQSSQYPVVDMTGLKGHYEVTIRWVPLAGRPVDADGKAAPPSRSRARVIG